MDRWENIYGQQKVKYCLDGILNSTQIPHAFLFFGPDGVGKHFFSVRLAQLLNVQNTDRNDSVSIKIKNLSEPYIKYIIPLPRGKNESANDSPTDKLNKDTIDIIKNEITAKVQNPYYKVNIPGANNIKINSIRDIRSFLSYNFSDIKYRIILIDDAHLMSEESQNALLKSLEEPPENFIFILNTCKPELLLETIKSRCWQVVFDPLAKDEIAYILKNLFNIDDRLANISSQFAFGSVANAIELINHDIELMIELTLKILRLAVTSKIHSSLKEMSKFLADNSTESIKLLIKMLIIWLDDIQKERYNNKEYFFNENIENIIKFNRNFPKVKIDNTVTRLNNIVQSLDSNVNLNVAILNLIFELTTLR